MPISRRPLAGALAAPLLAGTILVAPCVAPVAAQARQPAARRAPAAQAAVAHRELTADQQVRHVLGRLGFGARPGDVERVRAMGVDRWVALQLEPERIPDTALAAVLRDFRTLGADGATLLRAYPPPGVLLARRRAAGGDGAEVTRDDSVRRRAAARASYAFVGELQAARLARAVASERQLEEVLVDFWENHFSVFAGKDRARYYLPEYDATVRRHALGRFRDLLGAVATSPAMLVYLDNWRSVADSTRPTLARAGAIGPRRARGLNENYARELLELHTLGVDGGYTQRDVIEVARALTGWTLAPAPLGGGFLFRPAVHDAGEKTVLGRRLPAGRGIEDGEDVLDVVARHPATARHVARKLAVRLVSDSPPPALVERAAATFRRTDGDIRETVRTIVTSPEFFSRSAYRSKVKSPFELVASALRVLGAPADVTPRTALVVGRLGQPLYGHQAPDGWPETGARWMNSGAILNRINFGLAVAAGRVPAARVDDWAEAARLRALDRPAQVDGVIAALLGGEVSPDTRRVLLAGVNPLAASAPGAAERPDDSADGASDADAMDGAREAVRPGRQRPLFVGALPPTDAFAHIVGLALGSPEFQRR